MSRRNPTVEVFAGIALLLAFHFMFCVGILVFSSFINGLPPYWWAWPLLGIGLSQLVYAIPLCLYYRRRRQFNTMKGVIIGAVITMLLNGGCFLVFSGELGL